MNTHTHSEQNEDVQKRDSARSEGRIVDKAKEPSYVVVSGGTAANDFVNAFGRRCAFVLPGERMVEVDKGHTLGCRAPRLKLFLNPNSLRRWRFL